MTLATSRLTSQGQVSIPAEIRRRLGLEPGAVLEWNEEDGRIVVSRASRFSSEEIHQTAFPEGIPSAKSGSELKSGISRYIKSRHARR